MYINLPSFNEINKTAYKIFYTLHTIEQITALPFFFLTVLLSKLHWKGLYSVLLFLKYNAARKSSDINQQTKRSKKLKVAFLNIILTQCWFFLFLFFSGFLRSRNSKACKFMQPTRVFNSQSADFNTTSELLQKQPEKLTEKSKCAIAMFKSCYKWVSSLPTTSSEPQIWKMKKKKTVIICNPLSIYPSTQWLWLGGFL